MASTLLLQYLEELAHNAAGAPALDLACGNGRNGLALVAAGMPVVFADRDVTKLESVEQQLSAASYREHAHLAELWSIDFELPGSRPLHQKFYSAILVFRYLHRPLLPAIKQAISPGGLVIYETFTVDQAELGRPRNPDYLLQHGELEACFKDWEILQSFDGIVENDKLQQHQALAQIVARRPLA